MLLLLQKNSLLNTAKTAASSPQRRKLSCFHVRAAPAGINRSNPPSDGLFGSLGMMSRRESKTAAARTLSLPSDWLRRRLVFFFLQCSCGNGQTLFQQWLLGVNRSLCVDHYKGQGRSLKSTGPPSPASASRRDMMTAMAASSLLGLLEPGSSMMSILKWELSLIIDWFE